MATDAELNAFESLKKIAPFRHDDSDKANKKRKKLKELRKVLAARRWGDELPGEDAELVTYGKKYVSSAGGQQNGAAGGKKRKVEGEGDLVDSGKKKRAGAKERKKLKARAEAAQSAN